MVKKLYRALNSIVWSFAGALIGYSIYKYYHYRTHRELYEMQSAPWYAQIQIQAVCFCVVALLIYAIRWMMRKKYGEYIQDSKQRSGSDAGF